MNKVIFILMATAAATTVATEPRPSLTTQIRKWESVQRKLSAQFLKEVPASRGGADDERPIRTVAGGIRGKRFLFKDLPGFYDERDFYNFMGWTWDPWSNQYIHGFNYTYCQWLKKRGVTFWRYTVKRVCDQNGCRDVGWDWEESEP